ncbi:hypothetical protein PGQ11_009440 [Apiospora arundinis]|uniref:Uncharacterized protein n=1 Tax=Apiospora arundinis TaxID=335852 RepID=A0ABR2III8_9PEZI
MTALDILLDLRAKANDQRRSAITLKPKNASRPSMLKGNSNIGIQVDNSIIWPPVHLSQLDIAQLCQQDVHTALYGITPENVGSAPSYPIDQDNPVTVRRFLCYENLTKNKGGSTWALCCALVAFLDDNAREAWYASTGPQNRFYSTLPEFLEYAKGALRHNMIERVICLLTPWFYDATEVRNLAREGNVALPIAWEKRCFRSGMTLVVTRDGNKENSRAW